MAPLIGVHELDVAMEADARLVVVDVRWALQGPSGRKEFNKGHIPGACYVDLERELSSPPGDGGRHPLPDPDRVAATLRRCGVHQDSWVAVYDTRESLAAARAWWVFRDVGVRDVRVLDGGYAAWVAADLPIQEGSSPRRRGTFAAQTPRMPRLDADTAAGVARSGVLLDARSAERYRGEDEPVDPVAGHIPGAVCAPTTDNLNPDGTFRDSLQLAARFAGLGVMQGLEVGSYCGSGVTAAHQLLALEIAGVRGTLYPGSWSEWIRDPARPVVPPPS